jgi:hypothetical protein
MMPAEQTLSIDSISTDELIAELTKRNGSYSDIYNPVANEIGYKIGECLLRQARTALVQNDTMELREDLVPICYAFLRLMMIGKRTIQEIPEILNDNKAACKNEGKKFIDNALALIG